VKRAGPGKSNAIIIDQYKMHNPDPLPLSDNERGQQPAQGHYKVMDTLPQAELDALTKLASYLCQAPVSIISLTGTGGQSFITHLGLDIIETPLEISFCQHVIASDGLFLINDAVKSAEFKENPLVAGPPYIRFFAGVPLKNPEGLTIGTLCVMDKIPRTLTIEQKDALATLSSEIITRVELHKKNYALKAELLKEKEKSTLDVIDDLADYKFALDKTSMISITDGQGVINYVNEKFCEISKFSAEELIGNDHRIVNSGFHSKEFMNSVWDTISKGKVFQNEIRNKAKDGSFFWVATTIFPFMDESGKPHKYLTISYDVTQKKHQERQLTEVKVLAEKLTKSKDIFLTNMSHEIRTPLNAITGLSKLLSKTDLDSQQRTYINGIESASDNLLSVINDLLDFSKIEAGKITLENISFNFETISQQAINILTHKAEEKGLSLACEIDPKIAPVLIGDPFRINQVYMNMLGNAIKFTEQGHVHLKASLLEESNSYQKILIEIEDTGVGISEDYLDTIFDKFTQEDETVVRKFGGTGLGMSITKELMELMNGSISVNSRKDIGTTISLIFNFKIGTSRVLEKKRTIKNDTSNIAGKRILLVEDNNLNRLLAKTILTEYGAIIIEAENGLEAVNMARTEYFDVILMDVQMPIMDGIKATQIIRKEINATVPIIALTANAIKGKLEQFFEAGMDDHIFKPYDELKLVNPIAKWLKKNAPEPGEAVTAVPGTIAIKPNAASESAASATGKKETATSEIIEAPAAEETKDTEEPLFNVNKLLDMSGKNNDFVIKMLLLFVNETPQSVQKIKEGYNTGDLESVKYYAHMMKPSIFNLGINAIKTEIVQIESIAEKGVSSPDLGAKISKLDKVVKEVVAQMKSQYKLK
jgi:two-component system, sensor histidine kinase